MINLAKPILIATICLSFGVAQSVPGTDASKFYTPKEAIESAIKEQLGVLGTYKFEVKNASVVKGVLFLNSEPNYQDPKCLTVRCDETATRMLTIKFGGSPVLFLKGKCLLTTGRPVRVAIALVENGEATNLGYYQTHIRISNPEMLSLCTQ